MEYWVYVHELLISIISSIPGVGRQGSWNYWRRKSCLYAKEKIWPRNFRARKCSEQWFSIELAEGNSFREACLLSFVLLIYSGIKSSKFWILFTRLPSTFIRISMDHLGCVQLAFYHVWFFDICVIAGVLAANWLPYNSRSSPSELHFWLSCDFVCIWSRGCF